ncbi:alpha/beta hydrolase [Nonomuraea sp. K274]|uniref:Alpha/beta hydrolase n=2 Tax=Nonomuraea cypriaca TaxID=1187855 RepID=A0A931A4T2_9ACTN|nr:alpha/beta hydrolase [Nonomuraea cypriaca]
MSEPTRRNLLRGTAATATGAAVAALAAPAAARADGDREQAPTFVLVHSTSCSSSWWGPLIGELALRGHRALAVDLPGHGPGAYYPKAYQAPQDLKALATEPSPTAKLTVDDYAEHVERVVTRASARGPVILAGHGDAGGAVLGRLGNAIPGRIRHLVYIDAFLCVDLATMGDYQQVPENGGALPVPAIGNPAELGVARINWRSGNPKDVAAFKAALAADFTDEALRAMLNSLQPDEAAAVWGADVKVDARTWGRIPRTYVRFSKDRTFPVALQDRMIREADRLTPRNRFKVHTVAAPHAGPLHRPEIVKILDGLA